MMGYLDRNVRIWVDADKLVATGVTVIDVINAHRQAARLGAGRRARQRRARLRRARPRRGAGPGDAAQHRRPQQRRCNPVRLSDVALVEDGFAGHHDASRAATARPSRRWASSSSPARTPSPSPTPSARRSAKLQKTLPAGMKLDVIFDTTVFIKESVNEIGIELGLAVILTALVCWIFLGSLSSTMNVLFAIPMSLLGHDRDPLLLRLHAQHVHAARAVARRRPRRRRRRHGHGEHLPPRGDGQGPGDAPPARAPRRSPSRRSRRRSRSSRSSCRSPS